jgi:hypothetical protein
VTVGPREKKLLLALGVAIAVTVAVRMSNDGAEGGPSASSRPRRAGQAAEPGTREVVDLDLASLRPRQDSYTIERDPFRYGAVPTPVPTPTPPPPPPPPPMPEPTWAPPPPPPPPQPPPSDHLRFLGTFGPPEARIAVIVSGEEIYNVRAGTVLEDKFIVEEIGYESVALGFVGFPDAPPRRLAAGG